MSLGSPMLPLHIPGELLSLRGYPDGMPDYNMTTVAPTKLAMITATSPNTTKVPINMGPCAWILNHEISSTQGNSIRLWDLIILVPNVIFLFFLFWRLRTAVVKLQLTGSPMFLAFYGLTFLTAVISVLRCVVSMTVNATVPAGDITDKALWLILRFFMLATELSVIVFGLAFGHLDSRTSIHRVLAVTFSMALIYSSTQAVLEFRYPDDRFHVKNSNKEYDIFGHGGMLFWFASSVFFFVIYTAICFLPFTHVRNRFALPSKRSFYWYCLFLSILNLTQAVGSGLLHYKITRGMCVVDLTTYIYFSMFIPLVYGTFLKDFFATSHPPNILFSYKAQVDVESVEEDHVSMPHQIYSSVKPEPDLLISGSYDSTHFDRPSPNPLYNNSNIPINAELTGDFHGLSQEVGAGGCLPKV